MQRNEDKWFSIRKRGSRYDLMMATADNKVVVAERGLSKRAALIAKNKLNYACDYRWIN